MTGYMQDAARAMRENEELRKEIGRLRDALVVFAADSSWRRDGCCDANSPCFMGQRIAKEALK